MMQSKVAMMIAIGGWLYACCYKVTLKTERPSGSKREETLLVRDGRRTAWLCTLIAVLLECIHLLYVWQVFYIECDD